MEGEKDNGIQETEGWRKVRWHREEGNGKIEMMQGRKGVGKDRTELTT